MGLFFVRAAGLTKVLAVFIVLLQDTGEMLPFNKTLDDEWSKQGDMEKIT